MPRAERGFTLLEIVIALAIAALGIAAVAKATGGAATVAAETRERLLAVWVAGNRLSELRITRAWPDTGNTDLVRSMGGRSWHLTQTVVETPDDDVRRVSVEVYTDAERADREFVVHGYVARYRTAEELGAGSGPIQEQEGTENAGDGPAAPGSGESPNGDGAPDQDGGTERT